MQEDRTDSDLLTAWRGGDVRAGSALFDRHFHAVRRFFANKSGRDIEDLAQATFEACVGAVHRFEGRSSFRTYLLGIANNVLRAHYRARVHRDDVDELASVEDLGAGLSTLIASRSEHRLLLAGLRRIPLQYQVILELYYWEQFSGRQLGEFLEVPEDTARSRLRRGKTLLSDALGQLEEEAAMIESITGDLDRWAGEVRAQLSEPTG